MTLTHITTNIESEDRDNPPWSNHIHALDERNVFGSKHNFLIKITCIEIVLFQIFKKNLSLQNHLP
jgi:hypothetical protein